LRLKIGISKANIDTKDYVLGKLTKEEQKKINIVFYQLKDFIIDYLTLSKDLLMGKYNTKEKE
jgi:peptidyl-tRNA hydrolase